MPEDDLASEDTVTDLDGTGGAVWPPSRKPDADPEGFGEDDDPNTPGAAA